MDGVVEGVPHQHDTNDTSTDATLAQSKAQRWGDVHGDGLSPAAHGATAIVRAAYGGDSYGTLASKRSYVEVDYLRKESERKRAMLLVVPKRPSAAALLLEDSNRDDGTTLQRALCGVAPPEEQVLPSRLVDDSRPVCATDSKASAHADAFLRGLLMIDFPVACSSAANGMAGTHELGLHQLLERNPQLWYHALECPSVLGLDELISLDADDEMLLVPLPVRAAGPAPITIHTAMAKTLEEAFKSYECNVLSLAELTSRSVNEHVGSSVQLTPMEVPAMVGIDVEFLQAHDVPDLQEMSHTPAPKTATAHEKLSVSLDTQQIQQAVSILEPSKSKALEVDLVVLNAELTQEIQQIARLELPCVSQLIVGEEPLADVLCARPLQNLVLPFKSSVCRAPSFLDTVYTLCSHDLQTVLASSRHRLYLQQLPLPALACHHTDVAADFLAQTSSLLPCSTHSLELKLKTHRIDASPCNLGPDLFIQDVHQLIKSASSSCQPDDTDQAFLLSVLIAQNLMPAPIPALDETCTGLWPATADLVASEAVTVERIEHHAATGDVARPPTATDDEDQIRSAHMPSMETPMVPRAQRTQYRPNVQPSTGCAQEKKALSNQFVANERPVKTVAQKQSIQGQSVPDNTRWQDETGLIPAELLCELVRTPISNSAWGRFQSAFDFSTCDIRGSYFQYCSIVDELLEEAAEQRPRIQALIKPDHRQEIGVVESFSSSLPSSNQPTVSLQPIPMVAVKAKAAIEQRSAVSVPWTAESTTQVQKKRKLKQNSARLQPSNLKEFIAEATESRKLSKRSDITAPEGVPMCKLQTSLVSIIANGQSSLVLLPFLIEKALHAICVYTFVASREDRAVLWLSEDAAALAELHILVQNFLNISAVAAKPDIQCQLLSHHADVRATLKDCAIVLMTPSILDRAMRHDASLPRLLAGSTDVLVLNGFATASVVTTKYSRLFAPWLAEPRGSKGKTAVVFSAGELPQSIENFSTVLQKLRLERIISRLSTDPDIAALSSINYAASRVVKVNPSTPSLLTLKKRIGSLMSKLELCALQQASPSSQSLILLANEAGQNIRTAHSIGDMQAKDSWSEKYRMLVQTLVCLQTFEIMADSTAEAGLGVLCAAISDTQGKGRILKGALDDLKEELQRLVAAVGTTSASSMTKLATLQAVLSDEFHMSQSESMNAGTNPSLPGFKILVLVVDDHVATQIVAAVQPTYAAVLLRDASSDWATTASSDAQVYVATASGCLGPSAEQLWQTFSVVITMCESVDVICDPTLQQHVHAQRLRHVAILIEASDSVYRTNLDQPRRLDSLVSTARSCAGVPAGSTEAIGIDDQVCKRLADSTELTAVISDAETDMNHQSQQHLHKNEKEGQQVRPAVIVSNGALRRNDILRHLETNGVNVIERENSMTGMDMIITPSTGCVILTLANVQACTGQQPSQVAQSYMQGLTERLQQGRLGFSTIEVVIEHGTAGGALATTQGVGRLMKLLNELKSKSACGATTVNTPLAACKFNIHHSIGEPQKATAQKLLSLVQKHRSVEPESRVSASSESVGTISEQASADERLLVRSADGAINPMVAQALVQQHSPATIAAMGTQHLQECLRTAGADVPLVAVEQLQRQLVSTAARDKPGPRFLGRRHLGQP